MSYRILLVDPSPTAPAVAEHALGEAGYRVALVHTFEEATRQISLDCPDLLITAIRLGAFNGLHLLLRTHAEYRDLPVVVVGAISDFSPDISRYGAQFVASPIDDASLLRTVADLLAGRAPRDPTSDRRWPRKHSGLPATVAAEAARVIELSYGGMRLEMDSAPGGGGGPFDISFPTLGLSVSAVPRWSKPAPEGHGWWCGAEISVAGSDATRTWRSIVDSLN